MAEFIPELDFESACELLANSATDPYPVVMADLLGEGQEPLGLEVIEAARAASATTVIVVLTDGALTQPDLAQRARSAGADIVLLRAELDLQHHYGGPAQLARDMYALLCDRGIMDVGPELVHADEPGIQTVLYDTGEPTIRLLLTDLLAEYGQLRRVELAYVSPGGSGTHVLSATATLPDDTERYLLLKIGRDQEALNRELDNATKVAGLYSAPLIVPYVHRHVTTRHRNGWSAIALSYVRGAMTLRQWLADPRSAPDVPSVLRRLFLHGGLADPYRKAVRGAAGDKFGERLLLPPFRRVLVRAAVNEFSVALAHPDAAGLADEAEAIVEVIDAYVHRGELDGVSVTDIAGRAILVLGHGDLHGGNILINDDEQPQPVVIDLAAFGPQHWAYDPARLIVDILLRCVDGGIESFFWRGFGAWRNLARQVGELNKAIADVGPTNAASVAALRWFTEKSEEILPLLTPDRRWEWHTVLAEQFLRGTYQIDLPPAKRTFALAAAYDQMIVAGQRLHRG